MKLLATLSSLIVLALASCTYQPELTAQEKLAVRSFTPLPEKALLYVYRPAKIIGGFGIRPVFVDGEHVASIRNGTFVPIPLQPGTYRIQAAAPALYKEEAAKKAYPEITLSAQSGKTYFIRQAEEGARTGGDATMLLQTGGGGVPIPMGGWYPPYSATLMDPATGRADCSKLKQVGAEADS